jgi:putative flippase GtrA
LFTRYTQFCLVGGSGTLLDMSVLWLLASPAMLGWSMSLGKVIAAEVSLANNFVWNELWDVSRADHGAQGMAAMVGALPEVQPDLHGGNRTQRGVA